MKYRHAVFHFHNMPPPVIPKVARLAQVCQSVISYFVVVAVVVKMCGR